MQRTDWSDFQAFLALARAGKLARAATATGVNATTVARRLRRLESCLGVTLFEQTREGHALTEAGEQLLNRVEAMARLAEAAGEDSAAAGGLSGTLRISASEGFGSWFLARQLPDFARLHPGLTIDLVASSGFLRPSKREADLAIMLSRPKAGPVIARKLSDYALRLYASRAYLDRAGAPQAVADLAKRPADIIGYVPDLLYAPELAYLSDVRPGLSARLRSSSIIGQYSLLCAGAGVGVLPCFIGDAADELLPVLPDWRITRSFWLVMHRDTHQLARIRAAKEWLVDCVHVHRTLLLPGA